MNLRQAIVEATETILREELTSSEAHCLLVKVLDHPDAEYPHTSFPDIRGRTVEIQMERLCLGGHGTG